MEQALVDISSDDPEIIGLHQLILYSGIDPSVIATAIEKLGVYCWDRFGRIVKADSEAQGRALDALADYVDWERRQWDTWEPPDDEYFAELGPQSRYLPPMKDYLNSFGWWGNELPDMRAIAQTVFYSGAALPRKSAETRRIDTLLVLIAALAKEAGIDLSARGAAARLSRSTEMIGAPVSDDTIGRLLPLIRGAVEKRDRSG